MIDNWWRQGMMGGAKAHYDGIKAFSETDFTEDLKAIDVPTLVMHGDDDQIVPIADSALLSAKLLKNGTLKVYEKLSHGMCTTHADVINPRPAGVHQELIRVDGRGRALAPTERAVFLLREVFELDFDEIATSVGKSEANTRQILTRARGRLRDSRPRFTVSRRESEEIVRRFRHACVTGNVEELMAVLHADAQLVADGGGKAAAATRPVLGADCIAKFVLGYAGKLHWSESDFQLVTINGAPGLLMRHPIAGNGTYSFDIADGRIRAIYVVRNPDKLRGFLEHTH